MAKKRKRRLKRWVRVVLWCITLILVSWPVYWSVSSLKQYWAESVKEEVTDEVVETTVGSDNVMRQRMEAFKHAYTRLDTADIALSVYDLTAQAHIIQWHARELMPPASCIKLMTAIGALKRLGCDHEYTTRMMTSGYVRNGVLHGNAILVADDDPLLDDLSPLVGSLKEAGINEIEGKVVISLMRMEPLKAHDTAASWDIPFHKLTPLLKGAPYVETQVKALLRQKGIRFGETVVTDEMVCTFGARTLKTVKTGIADVVEPMLIHSSNIKADALFYHMNHYYDRYAPMRGSGERQIDLFLREDLKYDVSDFTINDGSGLSPENRVNADFLMSLLCYAWHDEQIKNILLERALATPAHPVRHGSLLTRMTAAMFRDRIFCKTGTLTSYAASSLSGYAKGADGHWYAFVVINRNSPVAESRLYQDNLCKELVR